MTRCILLLALMVFSACTNRQAGLSEYHEALALMEQGDAPSALERLEQAAELAQTDSLRALVQSQMGTLYFQQHLLDRSLESYRRAFVIDSRAADTVGLIYDLRDIGNVMRASHDTQDSCIVYFEQARQLAIASSNLAMQHDVESQMAAYYLYHNQLDEARSLLMPALDYIDDDSRSGLTYMLADYYARSKQTDSAVYYYQILLSQGSLYARQAAHRALAEYALDEGDHSQALLHLRQYELLSDSVNQANDAAALRRTAALYDYSQHQRHARQLERTVIITVSAVILLALLFFLFLLYASRRRMHYRLKLQRMEQLLAQRERKEQDACGAVDEALQLRLEQLIADPRQPPLPAEEWFQVESAVNQRCPDFLQRIDEFCHLTPQERRVCLLIRLGIAPAAIAQLTAHTKQAVTNTRSRLYLKAFGQKGTPAQWDTFILSL